MSAFPLIIGWGITSCPLVHSYALASCQSPQEDEAGNLMGRWFETHPHFSLEAYPVFPTGVVTPSPPCKRALQTVASLLEADGHEIITMFAYLDQCLSAFGTHIAWHSDPPSPLRALQIGSQLMANACTFLRHPCAPPTQQPVFFLQS